ncbi:MAG: hypothetical protein ACLUQK_06935 [Clostridium sp.]
MGITNSFRNIIVVSLPYHASDHNIALHDDHDTTLTEESGNPAKEDGMNYHRNDEEMMRQAKGDEPITIDKLNDELESLLEEQAEMRRNAILHKKQNDDRI